MIVVSRKALQRVKCERKIYETMVVVHVRGNSGLDWDGNGGGSEKWWVQY